MHKILSFMFQLIVLAVAAMLCSCLKITHAGGAHLPPGDYTIIFSKEQISASSLHVSSRTIAFIGCNHVSTEYALASDEGIVTGPWMSTKVACPFDTDHLLMAEIDNADYVHTADSRLYFYGQDEVLLVADKFPQKLWSFIQIMFWLSLVNSVPHSFPLPPIKSNAIRSHWLYFSPFKPLPNFVLLREEIEMILITDNISGISYFTAFNDFRKELFYEFKIKDENYENWMIILEFFRMRTEKNLKKCLSI